jgi:phospholipid transport system substrate-binding protein
MKMKLSRVALLAVMWMFIANVGHTTAGEPTEAIRNAINQGVDILRNAKLDNQTQRAQVIDRLRQIVYPLFDFNEMAMRSMGANWRKLNPEQRKEFVAAFTTLLEKTYADQIDLYDGQQVNFGAETIDGNYAQVESKIIDKKGQNYSVVYRLHRVDGRWRIYDVVAENISLVNNYRSQFNRVIAKSSFEELIRIMKQQAS